MKKVLFTATVDSHILHFHLPYLKLFKEKGYEVHVATNGTEKIPYCDKKHVITFERSPYKINNLKAIKQLTKIINEENFEIIHTHTPMGSVVTRLAAKKARKKGTKVIYTAHGFHFYKGASILNWILFYPVEKFLSKHTDTIITINTEDYELAKKKFKKTNIEYVPGVGIDPQKFDLKLTEQEKKELRKKLGINKNDFVIICIGELNNNKNQIMQIEAMKTIVKKNKNIKLLLAGDGDKKNYLKEKIKEYNLQENIFLLGYRKDIPKILQISNLALSTSKREGLPVNVIEALTIGIPVIGTNCRGTRDLIENEKNGYIIEINDIEQLVLKIESIYNNKLTIQKKSNEYTLEKIIKKIEKIYFSKRILHLLASNKYSGAENVACTIIKVLENKCDIAYCSPNGDINEILRKKKIAYIPIKKMSRNEIKKVIKIYNPDIIHTHDFKASILTATCNFKGKIISHIHKNDTALKKISLKSVLYLISSPKFSKILIVSKSIINEYYFAKALKKKIYCINNYIDAEKIKNQANKYTPSKTYEVFFLGRLSEEKGPLEFIEIINQLKKIKPDIKAVMIGDGNKRKKCQEKINLYSLEKNIDMIGFKENPFPYIKNAKYGIMPSKFEGFGLSAVESMILNKPIFNSGVGGLSEIFKEEPYLICHSINEYVTKIKNNKKKINFEKITEKYCNKEDFIKKIKEEIYEI